MWGKRESCCVCGDLALSCQMPKFNLCHPLSVFSQPSLSWDLVTLRSSRVGDISLKQSYKFIVTYPIEIQIIY